MAIKTGTVKFGKTGQGSSSRFHPDILRFNIVVTADDGTEVRAWFNEGTQPYESLCPGDRVYIMDYHTKSPKLSLMDEQPEQPTFVPSNGTQTQVSHKSGTTKSRNKYDVVKTTVADCVRDVDSVAEVMKECIKQAGNIRNTLYDSKVKLSGAEILEYDRALAVTIFIKATEGKEIVAEPTPKVVEEPVLEPAESLETTLPF